MPTARSRTPSRSQTPRSSSGSGTSGSRTSAHRRRRCRRSCRRSALRRHVVPGSRQHDIRGDRGVARDGTRARRRSHPRRNGSRRRRARAGRSRGLFSLPRRARRPSDAPARVAGARRGAHALRARARLRRCRPPRLPRDRGRSDRARSSGTRCACRRPADRRRQRQITAADPRIGGRRRRCVHDRIGDLRRFVLADQRLRSATRCWTSSTRARKRRGSPRERFADPRRRGRATSIAAHPDALARFARGPLDRSRQRSAGRHSGSRHRNRGESRRDGSRPRSRAAVGRRFAVVSDATTQQVLGARVTRALASLGAIDSVVLDATPHPDIATVERVRHATAMSDTLVAVGSGTINDLCKYAAATDGKPYVVFATAPSMNGYTSMNAAITVAGHKKTLPARAPLGVYIDLGVFAAAPQRMIRSGLGDSLCRSTAQADWLLSRHLRDTPYRDAPFALLAADEAGAARRARSAFRRRPRRDARARAHARSLGPRHDDLRRQLPGEPGRAPDQPLHRHVRAGRSRRILSRRAGRRRDAHDGANPGDDARRRSAARRRRTGDPRGSAAAVWRADRRSLLERDTRRSVCRPKLPKRCRRESPSGGTISARTCAA